MTYLTHSKSTCDCLVGPGVGLPDTKDVLSEGADKNCLSYFDLEVVLADDKVKEVRDHLLLAIGLVN